MINLSGKNQIVLCISAGVLGVVMFTAMLFINKVPAYRPQTSLPCCMAKLAMALLR